MKNKTNIENNVELLFFRYMKPIRWIHGKRAKFALNIIGWVEALQMHDFELKWHIQILIT